MEMVSPSQISVSPLPDTLLSDTEDNGQTNDTAVAPSSVKIVPIPKRKTRVDRNKEKRLQEMRRERREKGAQKHLMRQIGRLDDIVERIEQEGETRQLVNEVSGRGEGGERGIIVRWRFLI